MTGPGYLHTWERDDAQLEMVNHPSHYGAKDDPYEVVKVLEAWGLTDRAYLWNTAKYIARAGKKGGPQKYVEDLKKAQSYLSWEIERAEGGSRLGSTT